ncbi:uncharacterized protein LOC117929668 [Vitis riparia]|uniref:uncharacterized protein LOC117929668 n=1 Tax=Vitis riparia TaxID=96939 RepID=UPI00155B3F9F|nr:uncharacterized protein LOC117929668 [Vitis riparia]XP_034705919.1 uncharacterized protein LOC117929668 [Vitis riparia]XP_034705920.1 uncharacterized protein LOC117929668 [Vitis riparia]XP_034705921.1 uncharacterized protein LOC117929668 [Vitis riparia]XP_034705922.1 uncharacterized protein LOC117929668 [Vitis riparia]XP_034705923.1 uncharacterized protein LOC117929668 [Vitis riparia]
MATQQQGEEDKQTQGPSTTGWRELIGLPYQKIKENVEANRYVWTAYVVVYGGFGLWLTYRWRKLRRTEDRVRALQERLRKLAEAREQAASATSVEKAAPVEKASLLANKSPQ